MPYKKFKKKNNFKRPKSNDYMDNYSYPSKGQPKDENAGVVSLGISAKAMKDLPKSSYSVKADPYDSSLPTSRPYNILNGFNKKVGGNYAGEANLDGGNVQQYANSNASKMLKYFDFFRMKIKNNYRYKAAYVERRDPTVLVDNDYQTSGLIDECRQAIAEATSVLQSTTFTQMGIYRYAVETDMAMGKAERKAFTVGTGEHAQTIYLYTNLTDVIYSTLTYYQLVLQNALVLFNWHNSFRLKMGTMIRSSWNRETPTLNSLFGLFKKKSFLSLWDSIALSFPGEYVDTEWAQQVNMLNSVPSRRSDSITDPVLEVQTRNVIPSIFKLWILNDDGEIIGEEPLFDAATDFKKACDKSIATITEGSGANVRYYTTYTAAIDHAMDNLSAENTMAWARGNAQFVAEADNAYFNEVKYCLDVVQLCLTTFKTKFNDIREVLDTVSRTGLVTWVKGFRPSVTKDTDVDQLFDNQLINDLYTMIFSGPDVLKFDAATKRWTTFSLWNMYTGIPEYDSKSGGCFLTLSAKKLDPSAADDPDKTLKYLPLMFFYDSTMITENGETFILGVSRTGKQVKVYPEVITMNNNVVLDRLVPLTSQANLQLRVPKIAPISSESADVITGAEKSTLYKTLTQMFGTAKIDNDVSLDPDILAIYQIQIEDVTNNAIAYARATSPFKGSTGYTDLLGFTGFGVSKRNPD